VKIPFQDTQTLAGGLQESHSIIWKTKVAVHSVRGRLVVIKIGAEKGMQKKEVWLGMTHHVKFEHVILSPGFLTIQG